MYVLAEFNLIKLDPERIFERNKEKVGPEYTRKNGILINSGGALHDSVALSACVAVNA